MKKRKTDNSRYAAAGLLGVLIIILSLTFLEKTSSKPPSFGKPPPFDCNTSGVVLSHDYFHTHTDETRQIKCIEAIDDLLSTPRLDIGFIGGTCVYEVGHPDRPRYYFEKRLRDAVAAGCFE